MFTQIYPKLWAGSKIVKENSTHVAIRSGAVIDIWIKGFSITGDEDGVNLEYKPELINTIGASSIDDLFYMFNEIEEELRYLRNENNEEFKKL